MLKFTQTVDVLTKTKLKETIEQFPERFTMDELIDKLIFIDKVERSNRQSQDGHVIAEDDLDKEIEKWFE